MPVAKGNILASKTKVYLHVGESALAVTGTHATDKGVWADDDHLVDCETLPALSMISAGGEDETWYVFGERSQKTAEGPIPAGDTGSQWSPVFSADWSDTNIKALRDADAEDTIQMAILEVGDDKTTAGESMVLIAGKLSDTTIDRANPGRATITAQITLDDSPIYSDAT